MPKNVIDVLNKAAESNEPVFVIRAQDAASIAALSAYNVACSLIGVDLEHLRETQKIFNEFVLWQKKHPNSVKKPDL